MDQLNVFAGQPYLRLCVPFPSVTTVRRNLFNFVTRDWRGSVAVTADEDLHDHLHVQLCDGDMATYSRLFPSAAIGVFAPFLMSTQNMGA